MCYARLKVRVLALKRQSTFNRHSVFDMTLALGS
jgi:hypothetical protein